MSTKPEGPADLYFDLKPTQFANPALAWADELPQAEKPPEPSQEAGESPRPSRKITAILLGLVGVTAVTAAALGGYAIASAQDVVGNGPSYSAAQINAQSEALCEEVNNAINVVDVATHMQNPLQATPGEKAAMAINARLSFAAAMDDLLIALRNTPAADPAKKDAARRLSVLYQQALDSWLLSDHDPVIADLDKDSNEALAICGYNPRFAEPAPWTPGYFHY